MSFKLWSDFLWDEYTKIFLSQHKDSFESLFTVLFRHHGKCIYTFDGILHYTSF